MDYSAAYDLISRTYGDQLHGSASFDTQDGGSLRVEIDIDDDEFRIAIRDSRGYALIVTPGAATAQLGTQTSVASGLDTQAALAAWKSQPPLSLAPVTSGLSLLSSSDPLVTQVVAALAGVNGSLGFGFFPTICWYTGLYPSASLPGLHIQNLSGRVCLRDVSFSATYIAFTIDANAQCDTVNIDLGIDSYFTLQGVRFDGHVTVEFDISTSIASGEVFRLTLNVEGASTLVASSEYSSAPLSLSFPQGLSVAIGDLKVTETGTGSQVQTGVSNGPIRWNAPKVVIGDCTLSLGSDAKITATAIASDELEAVIILSTDMNGHVTANGKFRATNLQFTGDFQFPQVDAAGFSGALNIWEAQFGPTMIRCLAELNGQVDSLTIGSSDSQLALSSVNVSIDAEFRSIGATAATELRITRAGLQVAGTTSKASLGVLTLNGLTGQLLIQQAYMSASQAAFSVDSVGQFSVGAAVFPLGDSDTAEFTSVSLALSATAELSAGASTVRVDSCSLDASSATIKVAGFSVSGVASGAQIWDFVAVNQSPVQGRASILLYPASGSGIPVTIPSPYVAGQVVLDDFSDGSFQAFSLEWQTMAPSLPPKIDLILYNGAVNVGKMTLTLDGQPVDLQPAGNSFFHVAVGRLEYHTLPPAAPRVQAVISIANSTQISASSIQFDTYSLSFNINQVNASAWTVGEFDARFAAELTITNVQLTNSGSAAPLPVSITSSQLNVLSDEYLCFPPYSPTAKRRLIAELEVVVESLESSLSKSWDTGDLPADTSALLDYLSQNASGSVATVANLIQAASNYPLGVDVDLYMRFQGNVDFTFNAGQSTSSQIVFDVSITVTDIQSRADVIGEVCLIYRCYRKTIYSFKPIHLLGSPFTPVSVQIKFFLSYNPMTNSITLTPHVDQLGGVLSIIASQLADILIAYFDLSYTVDLPPDLHPTELKIAQEPPSTSGGPPGPVDITLGATVEKTVWS